MNNIIIFKKKKVSFRVIVDYIVFLISSIMIKVFLRLVILSRI